MVYIDPKPHFPVAHKTRRSPVTRTTIELPVTPAEVLSMTEIYPELYSIYFEANQTRVTESGVLKTHYLSELSW